VGLQSSVDARSHFPRQTWALALHRGTMKQALAPFCFTLLQCSAHLRFGSRVPLGRDERLGGRGGRAKACCDRGSGEDGFCRWVEGTGPRLPRLGAQRSNRREERLASSREQWWLGARWTMNASVLRSNKEFSSQLQETNVSAPLQYTSKKSSLFAALDLLRSKGAAGEPSCRLVCFLS
jgi:hypothetical protein